MLGEIRKALKPRGLLGFNSTFFNGAYVEGTGGFWRRWIVRAVQVLREQGIAVKHEGHAAAMQWLSADDYAQACRDAGLRPTSVELVKVDMSAESLADIGRFSLFIEGALPGVPLEEGSKALQIGLERTMDELKVDSVERNWLERLWGGGGIRISWASELIMLRATAESMWARGTRSTPMSRPMPMPETHSTMTTKKS